MIRPAAAICASDTLACAPRKSPDHCGAERAMAKAADNRLRPVGGAASMATLALH